MCVGLCGYLCIHNNVPFDPILYTRRSCCTSYPLPCFHMNSSRYDRWAFDDSSRFLLYRSRRPCKCRVNKTGPALGLGSKKKRGTSKSNDILVWGDLVVYTSPDEAKSSLETEEVDEQFVRLIKVAENAQLRLMLEAGAELCGGGAALYVRVDPTCPIYWVRWDDRKPKADLDIVCDIPHSGDRSTVLKRVQFNADGKGGVKIRHARNKPSETSTPSSLKSVLVSAECGRIVGSQSFPRRSSPRGHESGGGSEAGEREDGGDEGDDGDEE